jgi:hypothetical protein
MIQHLVAISMVPAQKIEIPSSSGNALAFSTHKLLVGLNIHVAADIVEISSMYVYTRSVAEERHGGGR